MADFIEEIGLDCAWHNESMLKLILDGISDIVGIYKPDHTLIMYNKAGYDFFQKSPEELIGKKCYEILGRKTACSLCSTAQAKESGKLIRLEKFIPEMGKCMECTSNPIFGKNGKVEYVVEQLRDVTEQRKAEIDLQKSKEKYKSLLNLFPEAVIVISGGKIVLANQTAMRMSNLNYEQTIGTSFLDYVEASYKVIAQERLEAVINYRKKNSSMEYKLQLHDGRIVDAEIMASYIEYEGMDAVHCVVRDVTEKKREIEWASRIQANRLETRFPIPSAAGLRTIYRPAQTLSGDFYYFLKSGENKVSGIIGDVCGKGIAASLSASAAKVIFYEAVGNSLTPMNVMKRMNSDVPKFLGDEFIAVCYFEMDFNRKICTVVSAGIGEFSYQDETGRYEQLVNRGAFLGMFPDGMFEEQIIRFKSGYRFFFYSDGFAEIFEGMVPKLIDENGICQADIFGEISNVIVAKRLNDDDCTILEISIL